MKYKEKLPNFNYQVQRRFTKLQLSNAQNNYKSLIINCKKELGIFIYEVQTKITKL